MLRAVAVRSPNDWYVMLCCVQSLSERLTELSSKVEVLEGETANIHTQRMLQMKVKELESKLELELATRKRIEVSHVFIFISSRS